MTQEDLRYNLKPFQATGIGSVPFRSPDQACREILANPSLIPFWPQLVRMDHREEMLIQYSPPLPCLKPDLEARALFYDPDCSRSEALLQFYERHFGQDLPFFSLLPEFAAGFFHLLSLVPLLAPTTLYLKGQIVGPITLGLSVKLPENQFLIHDGELMDAVNKGLAWQAVYQAKKFESLGKKAILFIDEPSLSGYGSAFTPLSRQEVLDLLGETIRIIREQTEALIGLHCCGNSDWALLLSLDLDIINFDAFGFGDAFLLYPKEINRFLENGKTLAWGIVPTADYTGKETAPLLLDQLAAYFETLISKGIDRERLFSQALLTPACGLGSLSEETAQRLLALLSEVSLLARERFK